MIFAVGHDAAKGTRTLYIGLQEENVLKLIDGKPIEKKLDGSDGDGMKIDGMEDWSIVIMGPSDTRLFVDAVRPGYDLESEPPDGAI